MIVGSLKDYGREKAAFAPVLRRAMEYLLKTDFGPMAEGSYAVDGAGISAMVLLRTTVPDAEAYAELHERTVDVHYLFDGEERIGATPMKPEYTMTIDQREQGDTSFYSGVTGERFFTLSQGMYAVVFPGEVHRSNCIVGESANLKKVVVKIPISPL